MTDSQHILIIGYVWPEPESSAAGRRMMQLVDLFQSHGWKVTFASAASETGYTADLQERGIEMIKIEVNSSDFDTLVGKLDPDIVLFDRFVTEEQFGWRVAEQCPGALRLLDTEDLHCLRKARQKAVKEGRSFSERDLLREETARREVASIYRCDLSLIISEYEMKLLLQLFGLSKDLLIYLPYMLDPVDEAAVQEWPSYESREHFVTIGNFRHAPNRDAAFWLEEEIWPRIREELPEAELHVYGAYPSDEISRLHHPDEGFYVEGRAELAEEVVSRARVLLAPLRFGAGLKGKLVESMQCGTPSVTTGIGAEGILGEQDWSGAVADDVEKFVSAAVELNSDRSAWKKAQKQGTRIINERFRKGEFGSSLIDRIGNLMDNLDSHRLKNFTGSMLMHHTMASTQFMSRWIEEKGNSG